MDTAGANGLAALLLGAVGLLVWVIRKKHAPRPTDRERDALAEAVKNVAYRRFNAVGGISDILGLGWVLLAYSSRALKEAT